VYRALQLIVSAILLSRPTMPAAEATRYAHVLQQEAVKRSFDPLTAVAIVHFETHWMPGLVSPDGEDYGLGQIRARWVGACRTDADPVNDPSDACRAVKASLLGGEVNLRRMAVIITANRELCKEKTGKADLPQWLAGYEGLNFPGRDRWCAPIAKTWQVVEYRKQLVARFAAHAAVAQVSKSKDATARRTRRAAAMKTPAARPSAAVKATAPGASRRRPAAAP
jgi:hypothetical protein